MTAMKRSVIAVDASRATTREDELAAEAPVELRLGGVPLAVLMRTPGDDEALARGFALTEGIVLSPGEIDSVVEVGEGDRFEIVLADGVDVDPERFRRSAYVSSSCGVCGKASIDAVRVAGRRPPAGPRLEGWMPEKWMATLRMGQPGFDRTGGLHAAALCLTDGTRLSGAEDVGRHNAVDKAIGALVTERWPLGEVVLAVSGRVSFEITQKAAVAGIPVVCGVSAASSLAAELAEEMGLTLIGFSRGDRFVVYAGADRLSGLV
ncbi:MAG TPA: formate dehydrogenase accessory sulfurtransferase FdhD [Acidimicrobiia bacterium]|nr:formate dehydrogenase accessory sulfurtransferase FdhD [Acidimicrobiia bacterium]